MNNKHKGKSPEIVSQYYKERKRIQNLVNRAKKRGFTFPTNVVPNIPKYIDEGSVRNLQKRDKDYLYKQAVYTSPKGVTITGTERRKEERAEVAKKAAETRKNFYAEQAWENLTKDVHLPKTDYEKWWYEHHATEAPTDDKYIILYNVYTDFERWQPSHWWSDDLAKWKKQDRDRGWGILTGAIAEIGEEAVAINIFNAALRVYQLEEMILYESGDKYVEDSRNGEINLALNEFNAILRGRPLTVRESIEYTAQAEANEVY